MDSKNILYIYIYILRGILFTIYYEREREKKVGKEGDKIKRSGSQMSSLIESIKISSKSDSINGGHDGQSN